MVSIGPTSWPKEFNDLRQVKQKLFILYEQSVNDRVHVSIVQDQTAGRSQFLSLLIEDQVAGRWVLLRLSTFRKVIKFLEKKNFLTARRLHPWEIAKLQIIERGAVGFIKRLFGGLRGVQ
jgi:hypothetical protein